MTHRAARRRALAAVHEETKRIKRGQTVENAVIPVTVAGWRTVLEDSQVSELTARLLDELDRIAQLDVNDPQVIGTKLRATLLRVASSLRDLVDAVEQVSWFIVPDARRDDALVVHEAAEAAQDLVEAVLDSLCTDDAAGAAAAAASKQLRSCAARLLLATLGEVDASDDDAAALVFGTAERPFTDRRGIICAGRIRAAYAGRDDELAAISRRLLRALLGDWSGPPPDAPTYAAALALSDRPLVCHQVARCTLGLVRARFDEDREATVAAIRRLGRRIRHSASTHFDGLAPAAARLRGMRSMSERARVLLDLYRLATEGQLRHTAWAVLELKEHRRDTTPNLSELLDLLLAERSPLTDLLSRSIHPEWRNASAHEEHHWDPLAGHLVLEEGRVSLHEVEKATGYSLSAVNGFEIGVACARLLLPEFARELDTAGASQEPALLDLEIRRSFGRHGLWVWDTVWNREGIEVILEVDIDRDLHSILAALLMAHLATRSVRRWRVAAREGGDSIEVERRALEAAAGLLPGDLQDRRLDVNVLLPLVASAKCFGGTSEGAAARDILKLALKHPLGVAQDETQAILQGEPESIARLAATLETAERALDATWQVLRQDANQRAVLDDLRGAREAAIGWRAGRRAGLVRLEHHINRLLDLYHTLPDAHLVHTRPAK